MYPPIVCFCGRSLGDLCDAFQLLKKRKIDIALAGKQIDPDFIHVSTQVNIQLGDILDALGVQMECCRARMLTYTEFKNYYVR
jgi:DNA-directed RNA polymerase subunit N (RpoN/RPB10)